jgi:hypothetical protein
MTGMFGLCDGGGRGRNKREVVNLNEIQDDLNEKQKRFVEISIKGAVLTAGKLAMGMAAWLCKQKGSTGKEGKQSLEQLTRHGNKIEEIPIADKNIKDFESIARKHGVSYAVEKDTSTEPPQHKVFFKAKNADAIAAAFKEYTAKQIDRQKSDKPPMSQRIKEAQDRVKNRVVDTDKHQRRGREGR